MTPLPEAPLQASAAARGMVVAADRLASVAGVGVLERGGTAADAAVAAAAVMAVVGPHYCGLGGDLLAVVQPPEGRPLALVAAGRAGSGADPDRLRAEGHRHLPLRGDIRSVTVPGAADGWLALHRRFGRLPLADDLAFAVGLAREGFAASTHLALASALVAGRPGSEELCPGGPLAEGQVVRLPKVARTLEALGAEGRSALYRGELGRSLLELGHGEFSPDDLAQPQAEWTEPLELEAFGHRLYTAPAPSQGYLTLLGAHLAEQAGLVAQPSDAAFAAGVAEATEVAGRDRLEVLHEAISGDELLGPRRLETKAAELASFVPLRAAASDRRGPDGDTTHLCAIDHEGLGISLTLSNALDFGSHLVAGSSGVFLHNRGIGFCLVPGHPNEYRPGRRPAHTLSPALVTTTGGHLTHLVGTMGGDAQPQILVQVLARLLHAKEDPATALAGARVVLHAPGTRPFGLWEAPSRQVAMEGHAPGAWGEGLRARGHEVAVLAPYDPISVGHAQVIAIEGSPRRRLVGAADPRALSGAALGR